MITAPGAPTLIPRSIITAALLAYVITSKFCDALPFYRLEKIFSRSGVDLNRATMCNWARIVAVKSKRLRKLLWDELRGADVMHIDETRIQVLKEPGRKATAQSFLWAYRATTDSGTITLFEYRMNRSGDAKKRLKARQRYSHGIADEMKAYTNQIRPTTLRGSPLAKAMTYMRNEWGRLTVFLEDGSVPIDNNPIENDIRPFAVGRKNWLFNDSQKGASANAPDGP